jgi:hypothetical protein
MEVSGQLHVPPLWIPVPIIGSSVRGKEHFLPLPDLQRGRPRSSLSVQTYNRNKTSNIIASCKLKWREEFCNDWRILVVLQSKQIPQVKHTLNKREHTTIRFHLENPTSSSMKNTYNYSISAVIQTILQIPRTDETINNNST